MVVEDFPRSRQSFSCFRIAICYSLGGSTTWRSISSSEVGKCGTRRESESRVIWSPRVFYLPFCSGPLAGFSISFFAAQQRARSACITFITRRGLLSTGRTNCQLPAAAVDHRSRRRPDAYQALRDGE